MKNKLGLYLHVPFCASKCRYCDFYSFSANASRMDAYVDALCARMEDYEGETVDTVYFGGGTPSLLGGERLRRIISSVRGHFKVTTDAEWTVECNPDSMTEELLHTLYSAGVNRLSVGVQSAHDDELRQLGRRHTFAEAKSAILLAQRVGFTNLSLDLMYGLPQQTAERFLESADALLALSPQHLSCYGLKLEPDTPMGRENPILPSEDEQADLYMRLCTKLQNAGFEHYEISNWARPGFSSRHNSKYWILAPYLGLGPAAHSYFGGKRFAYPRDLDAFLRGEPPQPEEDEPDFGRREEYLMLALRTADGISKAAFEKQFGNFSSYEKRFQAFEASGFTERTAYGWRLTEQGFLLSNSLILEILQLS